MKNIVFAAAALFAVSANANEALNQLDLDQDGAISQEEALNVEGMSADAWAVLDVNADGKLDEAEFAMFEEMQPEVAVEEAVEVSDEATATDTAVEAVTGAVEAVTEKAEALLEGAAKSE